MAQACLANVESFLSRLRNDINIESNSPNVGNNWPGQMENIVPTPTTPPAAPSLPPTSLPSPVKPPLNDITIQRFTMPAFTVPDPSIFIPASPVVSWPADPGSAPSLSEVVTPNAPTYTLPRVPTFAEISLPTAPDLDVVQFDGVRPDITLETPGNLFVYEDQPYSSDVRDAVMAKVLDGIRNGGTGLGAEAEQAIWERARVRLQEDLQVEIDRITDMFAAMGCSRPSGPMMGAVSRAQQDMARSSPTWTRTSSCSSRNSPGKTRSRSWTPG
ncbi:hypothetical protein [Solidesulfovibrio sp.]